MVLCSKHSRWAYGAALVATLALGLASRLLPLGIHVWDKDLGDALYAVCVYLALSLASPRSSIGRRSLAALAVCAAIEGFQLTGLPEHWVHIPASRWVLGSRFSWEDLVCYAAGVAVAVWAEERAWRRGPGAEYEEE